jgi:hypothetical protein
MAEFLKKRLQVFVSSTYKDLVPQVWSHEIHHPICHKKIIEKLR